MAWTERERPDVLCLQEIKTTDDLFPLEPFAELGYHAEVFGQKTYNGVALLSLTPITKVVRNLPDDEPGAPSRLIAGTVGGVRIVNVYVPNGQSPESDKFVYKMDWLAAPARLPRGGGEAGGSPGAAGGLQHRPRGARRPLSRPLAGAHPLPPQGARGARPHHLLGAPRPPAQASRGGGLYSWWDYRQLAFQKNNGLRIDLILGTKKMLDRCTGVEIFRDERKGESPSDHVPVVASFEKGSAPPFSAIQRAAFPAGGRGR